MADDFAKAENALRRAHEAGDVEAARKLAGYLKEQRSSSPIAKVAQGMAEVAKQQQPTRYGSRVPEVGDAFKPKGQIADIMRRAGIGQGDFSGVPQVAEMALGMLPGAGDVMAIQESQAAGQEMATAFRAGDYGRAASKGLESVGLGLGALPMIPALGGMIKAYHGSPHVFDAFDISRIGTGEGAQAYGHGLYFAENPKVAGQYAKHLGAMHAGGVPEFEGFGKLKTINDAFDLFRLGNQNEGNAIEAARGLIRAKQQQLADVAAESNSTIRANLEKATGGLKYQIAELEQLIASGAKIKKPGALYNVSLDVNPEDLLDWDAPLSQQSEKVKKAIEKLADDPAFYGKPFKPGQELPMRGYTAEGKPRTELTGGEFYKLLAENDEKSSRALAEAGIPGLRYRDAGSRFQPDVLPDNPIANEARRFLEDAGGDSDAALKLFQKSNPIERWATTERADVEKVIRQAGRPTTRNVVMFTDKGIQIHERNGQTIVYQGKLHQLPPEE